MVWCGYGGVADPSRADSGEAGAGPARPGPGDPARPPSRAAAVRERWAEPGPRTGFSV